MKHLTLTSALLATLASVSLASLRVYQSQPLYYYTYYSSASSSSPAKALSPYRSASVLYSHASPFARSLARSYRLADSIDSHKRQDKLQQQQQSPQQQQQPQQPNVIVLNETEAVPFTTSNAALSTSEYEAAGPQAAFEEGVGPATSFEPGNIISPFAASSKMHLLTSKSSSAHSFEKVNGKSGKKKNSLYEPQVVYSDVHPVYVKPPVDFKPVVYPNRRLDGIRPTDHLANQVTLLAPLPPYPFAFPRGMSSWAFGGPSAVNRGAYWESLASDESLHVPKSSSGKKSLKSKKKTLMASASKVNSAFVPLVLYPESSNSPAAGASVYQLPSSYQIQYHSPSYSIWPESTVHFSSASSKSKKPSTGSNRLSNSGSRRVNSPASNLIPLTSQTVKSPSYSTASSSSSSPASSSSSHSSSSLDTQKTKLPVGLTSWFLGGVRDLNGKHWKLPELTVNGVDVVPLNSASAGAGDASPVAPASETTPDLMMTSDGEYEKVEASVVDSTGLTETEKEAQPSVTFDDDSDFVNILS